MIPNRIPEIRKMILSTTCEAREKALNELIAFQKGDFKGIYEVMQEIRLPSVSWILPLHEFVPTEEKDFLKIWQEI